MNRLFCLLYIGNCRISMQSTVWMIGFWLVVKKDSSLLLSLHQELLLLLLELLPFMLWVDERWIEMGRTEEKEWICSWKGRQISECSCVYADPIEHSPFSHSHNWELKLLVREGGWSNHSYLLFSPSTNSSSSYSHSIRPHSLDYVHQSGIRKVR